MQTCSSQIEHHHNHLSQLATKTFLTCSAMSSSLWPSQVQLRLKKHVGLCKKSWRKIQFAIDFLRPKNRDSVLLRSRVAGGREKWFYAGNDKPYFFFRPFLLVVELFLFRFKRKSSPPFLMNPKDEEIPRRTTSTMLKPYSGVRWHGVQT